MDMFALLTVFYMLAFMLLEMTTESQRIEIGVVEKRVHPRWLFVVVVPSFGTF